jgi:hypothetical protein
MCGNAMCQKHGAEPNGCRALGRIKFSLLFVSSVIAQIRFPVSFHFVVQECIGEVVSTGIVANNWIYAIELRISVSNHP